MIGGQATTVNPFSVAINALSSILGQNPIVTPATASSGDPIGDLALASAAAYQAWGPVLNAGSYSIQKPPLFMYCNEVFYGLAVQAAIRLGQCGVYDTALALLRSVYDENRTAPKVDYYLSVEEGYPNAIERTFAEWPGHELNPHATVLFLRRNAYTRFILLQKAQLTLAYADAQFTQDTPESLSTALDQYLAAVDLLNSPYLGSATSSFEPNPLVPGLLARAQAALSKLRSGRNISGLVRPYPTLSSDLTSSSSAANPAAAAVAPTQYKYSTLIDRAKQLVALAGQIESSYLSSLQQEDNETYNLLKAQQDLETAGATVTLNALQVKEAGDGVTVAKDQKAETQVQLDTYTNWINAGMLPSEQTMISSYEAAGSAQQLSAALQAVISVSQAVSSSGGILGFFDGADAGTAGVIAASGIKVFSDDAAIQATTAAQVAAVQTSCERNLEQWQLQQATAQANLVVGAAQIQAAQDHLATATQEQAIAQLQDAHAQAIVNFLASKFTSAELYQWMSGILAGVYAYLLQQATCVAQQAEVQLNFERQQGATSIIKSDYWRAPTDQGATSIDGQGASDRRGLTGSARLLEDITQLDQYAFETNKRKLQLTKTFSLATLAPFEFQQFRQTGVLPFATPMSLYDQDFPGHYLRLIKTVRVSVVALVPPNQGIKATLSTNGISNVVVPGDLFSVETLVRPPESVALTSPVAATGVFQLDAQSELILPFESMGVDTAWQLEMPQAANAFDYDTIADVLVSVDYLAFSDDSYRSQVIKGLPKTSGADRAYRFTSDFADQWYWLNNPDGVPAGQAPMTVTFDTETQDFPPNLSNLTIANVLLYFMPADGGTPVEVKASLNFAAPDAPAAPPLEQSIGGVISTRRGNAPDWAWMINGLHSPAQTWTLTLPSDAATQALFTSGKIADILMIVSYQGSLPAWPA